MLEGAVLEGAVLEGAVLEGAVLEGAVLEGAVLEGAVLEGVRDERLRDMVCSGSRRYLSSGQHKSAARRKPAARGTRWVWVCVPRR
ncbi:pentapeptide repeat-containing protein [Promicromonospora sp. Populi]|uniref:pentapeptide repeat-containing protein n=1 Tax=Promicromonospora sp. Populi TaxID=3239420 RepID=UPI0034E2EA3B